MAQVHENEKRDESMGIERAKEHMRNAMRSKSTLDAGVEGLSKKHIGTGVAAVGLSQLKNNTF